ncbi:MAG: DEAD/DEAH box helicase [[Clostridium] scindens]|uniref:DEAD/DEAH box helicase n=1 Tax=Clostridium scindens (strain JCM 10418 / VPI 12708) TaxID=29347 RepID=UPI00242CF5A0|nr:DEAD/DEAH box helicase [[Clostridium] scindens]MCI6394710.1 DEAD/DEAH box helicase [[Clostridium] scindens]MDY4866230.1 DEAD/DEAH box helicase [[Clostridium] scindens]
MQVTISNEIYITNPTPEVVQWARENLVMPNPEYAKKQRMGLWTGNMEKQLYLFYVDGDMIALPCGTGKQIRKYLAGSVMHQDLADNGIIAYPGEVPLYDYQELAVSAMKKAGCGILQSPCGSGKTQMGIALAARLQRKTLWLTHTQDLLCQSYDRAKEYFPNEILGKITDGKVRIGSHLTFATVQTLSKQDLTKYKYTWDAVIVDECHRVSGTPASMKMFYRVISSLAARYKYGLSATVHRADGLIKSTFAALGDVQYQVPDEAVAEKTMQVDVLRRDTGIKVSRGCLDTDGTMAYSKLIPYLTGSRSRNELIISDLEKNAVCYNLILSDRLEHLKVLMQMLSEEYRPFAVMIDGKMTSKKAKAARIQAIEDMRSGRKHFLFASFSLAKEGLDIPRLDRLYLTTPKKDYAVVTQSIGRIARTFEGKDQPVCYDYVDQIGFCENQYKRRKTSYRKARCRIIE